MSIQCKGQAETDVIKRTQKLKDSGKDIPLHISTMSRISRLLRRGYVLRLFLSPPFIIRSTLVLIISKYFETCNSQFSPFVIPIIQSISHKSRDKGTPIASYRRRKNVNLPGKISEFSIA